jgi:hypothetical protein
MCVLAFFPVAVVPLWQLLQFVADVNTAWLGLVASQSVVLVWQFSQVPVIDACVVVEGLPVTA